MFETVKTLNKVKKYTSTYKAGLLQAKAYRVFKQYTAKMLAPYDISTLDWALLGILFDGSGDVRLSMLASELGVEAPLVTRMTASLEKKGLVTFESHESDSRVRHVVLTKKGKELVVIIEKMLRKEMRVLVKDVSTSALVAYLGVLDKIVENGGIVENDGKFYS